MEIRINREVRNYHESIFFGLSAKIVPSAASWFYALPCCHRCCRALSTAMQSSSLSYTPDRSRMRIRIFFSIRLTCTWLIPSFWAIWACV